MEKEEILKEVERKNTIAFERALKDLTDKYLYQQIKIDILNNAISNLSIRINDLERSVVLQKSMSIGNGPTVK